MKAKVCEKCGATQKKISSNCEYCQAIQFENLDISNENKEKLIQYLLSLEKTLHQVKNENDSKIAIFLILFIFLGFGWISMTLYNNISGMLFFLIDIIIGVVFFSIFGFYVQNMERKAIKTFYQTKMKSEIEDFLQTLNCSRHNFRMMAVQITDEGSPLYMLLAEL